MANEHNLPMPIKAKPYRHQVDAFNFVCDLFGLTTFEERISGAALLMEMGCGKSLVGIAVAGILYQFGLIDKLLIVCPLSVMGVWQEELEKFAAYPYTVTLLKGTMTKKREQLAHLPQAKFQIVVTNYETMWRLEPELLKYHAGLIIADEAHKLKDGTSRQSKAMHRLGDHSDYRLMLTGTAITNRELDIFSEYRFTNPAIFGKSFYAFRGRYFEMGGYGGYVPIFRKWMGDEFLEKLHSIAYRVRKDECLDLPEITEEVRTVDLEPKAMKLYTEIEEDSYAQLKDSEVTTMNILTQILRLSQLTGGHLTDDERDLHSVSTAKLDALSDILDGMQSENEKLVIMARFVPELDDIEALLQKKKIGYACVRGGVKERAEQVRRFQEDDDCTVFVGQIQAAGMSVSYNPDAKCPRFLQYLDEVIDKDQIPLIQEMMGYFLVPVTRAQKCFVIVGEGGAGKSQLLLVLNDILLGKENVSNVSWQALNERFKTAELFGKLANIFADLPTKNIDDNGIFKALVGEDYLTVEKKNKNPFSFQSTARLLFSCNNIPKNYGDRSEGFYRRLIIVRFDHAVPEDKKDPELLDKLRLEADGIFLFALEGLKRLMRNRYLFSETDANREELQQYREDSDSVLSFVKDCCETGDEDHCAGSTELFNAYKNYCEESGMKPYSQKKFIQQLLLSCPGAEKGVDKTGRRRIIRRVKLGEILG